MIVTEKKPYEQLKRYLKPYTYIFLIGCGECATICNTGGEKQLLEMKKILEEDGKKVTGWALPSAPCIASQIKMVLAKNIKALSSSEAILVLACGAGVQSVKANDRFAHKVISGCDTLFGAIVDAQGNFLEKCSACGDCILNETAGICPLTLCAKGILNGPCGGMDKGKCETDKQQDCAWVLIYESLKKEKDLSFFKKYLTPKDHSKIKKPHRKLLNP